MFVPLAFHVIFFSSYLPVINKLCNFPCHRKSLNKVYFVSKGWEKWHIIIIIIFQNSDRTIRKDQETKTKQNTCSKSKQEKPPLQEKVRREGRQHPHHSNGHSALHVLYRSLEILPQT